MKRAQGAGDLFDKDDVPPRSTFLRAPNGAPWNGRVSALSWICNRGSRGRRGATLDTRVRNLGLWRTSQLKTEGDRQVVEWITPRREYFGCATIPEELLQRVSATRDDGGAGAADDEIVRMLDYEIRAYRACEAYANGVLDASDYATIVVRPPVTTPPASPRAAPPDPGSRSRGE